MNAASRALVEVTAAIGRGDMVELGSALLAARDTATAQAIDETLLQSYLFVGYPRALQAFTAWREIEPLSDASTEVFDEDLWARRGRGVFEKVYGAQSDKLLSNAQTLHPDLAQWMVVEGYGKVLGRSGLDLQTRELCIIALLATQDAVPQLYSHLRGALHVGAAESDVEEALECALLHAPAVRAERARGAWETVRSRRGG